MVHPQDRKRKAQRNKPSLGKNMGLEPVGNSVRMKEEKRGYFYKIDKTIVEFFATLQLVSLRKGLRESYNNQPHESTQ